LSLVAIAAVTFQQRDAKLTPDEAKFGSVETRITTYDIAWRSAIKPHPVLGAGPGWFERPGSPGGAPHDIVIGELSEVGALGLAALLWFLWRVLRTTNQVDTDISRVAWYALLARVLASTVDIFWVAGPTTLPFLLVGLAVGEEPAPVPEPAPVRSLVA
jgi:O-antigen ligase